MARYAARLWGDNSLVEAQLRVTEAACLREVARASTSSSEQVTLCRRARTILLPVHALLLRRLADNTLLPGTIKEEEVTYCARRQAFVRKASDKPVLSEAVLQDAGVTLGYTTLLDAVFQTLASLMELREFELLRESAQAFVLTALDAIPRASTMRSRLQSEEALVSLMETYMKPQNYDPSFCASQMALQ